MFPTHCSSHLAGFHGSNEEISVADLALGARTYVRILELGASE